MILLVFAAYGLGTVSSQILNIREGDVCRTLDGGLGTCRALRRCKTAGDFKKDQPPICIFKGNEPVICCPNALSTPNALPTRTEVGHRAEQFCAGLDARCRNNLGLTKNVIGGVESAPRTQPFMVLIGYGKRNQITWNCGGSLISARFVLGAAHCVNPSFFGVARWARLGDLDLSSNAEDAEPINKRIVERITYPEYADTELYHDIAIFKLDSDVVFNPWISPICLHTKRGIEDQLATVIGWGRTDFVSATSDKLLEAEVRVYNETECNRLMFSSNSTKTPRGYLSDLMFCAGMPDGSKGACQGDSGGPLVIRKTGECVKTQIGITSYGNQCGLPDAPGVLTRVSHYIPWIEYLVFGDDNTTTEASST